MRVIRARWASLSQQRKSIQRHVVSEDIDDALPKYAGREQMQGKFAPVIDNRMTGIAAPLIADDIVILLCQQIDHASFPFVAPVDADNDTISHT